MVKAHEIIPWKNYPSEDTPLDEINLKKEDLAIDEIDNRVIELYASKADKTEISELFTKVTLDESSGIITFTKLNGSIVTIDTKLEKLAINFAYDVTTEQLVITLDDGTKQYVDMSALITQYEFLDSDTIAFQLENGKVRAIVKEGSIQDKHLRPDYLADITVQASIATQSASLAAKSEANAQASAESASSEADRAWAAAAISVPEFYIDFETGCLMSRTEAEGIEFEIVDGYFCGRVVA